MKELYLEDDVLPLIPKKVDQDGRVLLEVDGEEKWCFINCLKYCIYREVGKVQLSKIIRDSGIQPIENCLVMNGTKPNGKVYVEEEIEPYIPRKLGEDGRVLLDLDGEEKWCVSKSDRYAEHKNLGTNTLAICIDRAGLTPIKVSNVYSGKKRVEEVYFEEDVLPILPRFIDENGRILLEIDGEERWFVGSISLYSKKYLHRAENRVGEAAKTVSSYAFLNIYSGKRLLKRLVLEEDLQGALL